MRAAALNLVMQLKIVVEFDLKIIKSRFSTCSSIVVHVAVESTTFLLS